jgi:hypothetical protein
MPPLSLIAIAIAISTTVAVAAYHRVGGEAATPN